MICPKCSFNNIRITTETVSSKTKSKKNGCLWSLGRLCLIICTCGLWLLVGKHKGTEKTKIKNRTIAICQNCGYKWEIKN